MTTSADISQQPFEELDHRENDGIEVTLLWNRDDDSLTVFVFDARAGEAFELAVTGENALDVFHHPYAHAAYRGITYPLKDGSTPEPESAASLLCHEH
jgi:hypothetical protein